MKNVKFKNLKITNFKGIKSLEVNFSQQTTIKGENGTGKSTIFDALLWGLFGKNSQNDQKFSIKNTVDTSLNRADHIVEIDMMVDEQEIIAKRVYRETWTKRRGSEETEFTGHETLYFWNNVPCSQKEYQVKVSEVVEESLFKLLTNPLYFNVTLSETQRRDTLVKMAGEIPDEKIINGTPMYLELFAKIKGQKTLEDFRKEIAYEKTGLRKSLQDIPGRIDELLKSNPKTEDWTAIENEIKQKQKAIKGIDDEISGLTAGIETSRKESTRIINEVQQADREITRIKMKLEGEAQNEASRANMATRNAQFELEQLRGAGIRLQQEKKLLEEENAELEAKMTELREEWLYQNEKKLEMADDFICPTCKVPFVGDNLQKFQDVFTSNFNQDKSKKLDSISKEGTSKKAKVQANEKRIIEIGVQYSEMAAKEKEYLLLIVPLQQPKEINLEENKEYQSMKKITEQEVPTIRVVDTSDQQDMKNALQEGIDSLRDILSNRTTIERNNARIEELKADEKRYSKELADLEKNDFAIESFQKKRMELVEQSVNDKFKLVKFKLFKTLVNGGEEPCCETMVNNVLFSDLNHAMQLNAGIDIANALSQFYGVSAPIIVDNAEAVNVLQPTDSQLIKLYVTLDKELTVI